MKRDDTLWKAILEDLADDFIRFFVPNADDLFDLSHFEFLDKELETLFPSDQDEFHPRYVDKLIKVFSKTGEENWILVHVEVQGSSDKEFSERMFTYFYRIWDKYKRPFTAIAILTDKTKRFVPRYFEMDFLGTKNRYEFNVYKVLEADESELLQSDNPFAMVILTTKIALKKGKVTQEELFDEKLELAKRLFEKGLSKEKIRGILNFIKLYVRFADKELIDKFDRSIDTFTNKPKKTMGIEEFVINRARRMGERDGEKRGEKKGLKLGLKLANNEKDHTFVKSLLLDTDFDAEKISRLANVTLAFVEKVRKELKSNSSK
jgi:Putative transposase, YhgA-like